MANYKFTTRCETNYDIEEFSTDDFDTAVMKFQQYTEECEKLELGYDVNIVDNRTGEIYECVTHYARRVTEEELEEIDRAMAEEELPSPQSLGKSFADCVNENIPDELIDTVFEVLRTTVK